MGPTQGNVLEQTDAVFRTTQWTLLEGLRSGDEAECRAAAERAVMVYWPPVYACARKLVRTRDEAADLTQAFFVDVVIGRRLFERAEAGQGRLRGLLRASLKRYATDQWRRATARGRGRVVPLGELDREDSLGIEGDSERVFDRRWALAMFEEALRRCEAHFVAGARAKPGHWRLFEARVLRPALHGGVMRPLAEDAAPHGFASTAEAAAAVQTVKRRFDAIFREVIGETVASEADLADEYRLIRSLIEG